MEERISLCGDLCNLCPRFMAKSEEEKQKVAQLWHKVGWRDQVVSCEEISCLGCHTHKDCTYGLVSCTADHGVSKCSACGSFPCDKIDALLDKSRLYERRCREVCTPEEYESLRRSFFEKEINLRK